MGAEEGTRKGLQELGPKESHLSGYKGSICLTWHGHHWSRSLLPCIQQGKGAGEDEEAQGHFVKAEIEILVRNACTDITRAVATATREGSHGPPKPAAWQPGWSHTVHQL